MGVQRTSQTAQGVFLDWARDYDAYEALWTLLLVALGFVTGRVLAKACLKLMARAAERTEFKFDDAVVKHLAPPLRWGLPFLVGRWLIPLVELPDATRQTLGHVLLGGTGVVRRVVGGQRSEAGRRICCQPLRYCGPG
jgi:hypothetical protein